MEIKETKQLLTIQDVEDRIYQAFTVYRYLPPVKPQGYFNIFLNMKPEIGKSDIKPVIYGHNFDLAMEVCDVWWSFLVELNDPELLQLIKYRCGAPIIKNGIEVYSWSKIRPWKLVAAEFNYHRNTVKHKWDNALKYLLKTIKTQ